MTFFTAEVGFGQSNRRWVTCVTSVVNKDQWCTVDPMLRVSASPVTGVFIQLMHCPNDILGHLSARDAMHSLLQLGVLKKGFHSVKTVTGQATTTTTTTILILCQVITRDKA